MQEHASLGPYTLLRTLGSGGISKVKLGFNPSSKKYYAIRIIKPIHMSENKEAVEKELKILSTLKHPNIVEFIDFQENIDYQKKNGTSYKVNAIVFELVPGGDLFEYVTHSGRFSETISRTYFKKLIETVEYCHERGITHRNLKPENVLLDENFNIKLTDFGTATFICGKNNDQKLFTQTGPDQYKAPEMHSGDEYSGAAIDVFACGAILFLLVSGHPPFIKADPRYDTYYKSLSRKKSNSFWKKHESTKFTEEDENFYTPEFKNLIDGMLAPLAEERLTIEEVKKHSWYNGPVVPMEELRKEFKERKKKVDIELEKAKLKRKESKENISLSQDDLSKEPNEISTNPENLIRSLEEIELEQRLDSKIDLKKKRSTREHKSVQGFRPTSEMFFVATEREAFLLACLASQAVFNEFTVSDTAYRIRGKLFKDLGQCKMNIVITRVDDDMCCFEFHRVKGNTWIFYQAVKDLKRRITDLHSEFTNAALA